MTVRSGRIIQIHNRSAFVDAADCLGKKGRRLDDRQLALDQLIGQTKGRNGIGDDNAVQSGIGKDLIRSSDKGSVRGGREDLFGPVVATGLGSAGNRGPATDQIINDNGGTALRPTCSPNSRLEWRANIIKSRFPMWILSQSGEKVHVA